MAGGEYHRYTPGAMPEGIRERASSPQAQNARGGKQRFSPTHPLPYTRRPYCTRQCSLARRAARRVLISGKTYFRTRHQYCQPPQAGRRRRWTGESPRLWIRCVIAFDAGVGSLQPSWVVSHRSLLGHLSSGQGCPAAAPSEGKSGSRPQRQPFLQVVVVKDAMAQRYGICLFFAHGTEVVLGCCCPAGTVQSYLLSSAWKRWQGWSQDLPVVSRADTEGRLGYMEGPSFSSAEQIFMDREAAAGEGEEKQQKPSPPQPVIKRFFCVCLNSVRVFPKWI